MTHTGHTGYTGDVTAGGPPAVRELAGLTLVKTEVGEHGNNAYLLRCRATGEQLLIDAAFEADRLLDLAGPAGLGTVVTTHAHEDHWAALAEVVAATGADSVAHRADAPELPVVTTTVAEGDLVAVGEHTLEVIHLQGHTPGSIALLLREPAGPAHLFTGDSLFPGGVGNTEGDPVRFASLIDDVEAKLFGRLPDDTWFYPGHGSDSTLGAQRPHLAEWQARGW
uniref:MBL fold metallo-hydrolase n=1 Tax=Streptomyces sp. NBC_01393 TaxID=2903851 RepID=A0AAU3HYF2_9ACTN